MYSGSFISYEPGSPHGVKSPQDPDSRRFNETTCCFCVARYPSLHLLRDRCLCSTHDPRTECAPRQQGCQEAAKDAEEGQQETAQGNQEIRESATKGDSESK